MPDRYSTEYINSSDYQKLEDKLKVLDTILQDNQSRSETSRKLRYAEVDIEAEREAGRLQPDELYVPQHIIDTNIRREQSPYVQYITQSARAVICSDIDDETVDLSKLDSDLTRRLRYDKWQLSQFANIDAFQADGYSVMEVVQDLTAPGHVSHEFVQYGDFAFISDTRDLQSVEMVGRAYYYTKTRLYALVGTGQDPENDWSKDQVDKVCQGEPSHDTPQESSDYKDRSLYKVIKFMFRINGVVNVAWGYPNRCSDWLRKPRPLFIGNKKSVKRPINPMISPVYTGGVGIPNGGQPQQQLDWQDAFETDYPYVVFPYLISENDTISQLKGRVFLDQDLQEAVASLISSTITKARRSAGLYFSKDVSDPNDDILLQKNIFLRSGCLINSKVTPTQLMAPDPGMFSAIQTLMVSNQQETSQVNFAVNNRKDSRKTAKEVETSDKYQQILSTVQVVLYSIALTQLYRIMVRVIKSRVQASLIIPNQLVRPLYDRNFLVKPSGDVDVIEKQQTLTKMMNAWPVIQNTPMAEIFLSDLVEMMFPERAAKYLNALAQAKQQQAQQQQQQQSQQAQFQQQMMQFALQLAQGIVKLSKHQEFFSEAGKLHAFPVIEHAAEQIEAMQQQMQQVQSQQAQQARQQQPQPQMKETQ